MQEFLTVNGEKFSNMITAQVMKKKDMVHPLYFNIKNPNKWSGAFNSMKDAKKWTGYWLILIN